MKAQNLYGAESYLQGFSGYSIELLTLHYKGFIKMLKGLTKNTTIDTEKYYKNETELRRNLNESKLQSPIIVIDPTHQYRNATAGLGKETYKEFLEITKTFLKKPQKKYFTKQPFNKETFKKKAKTKKAKLLTLTITTTKQEGSIAGSKMKKYFEHLNKELERNKQKIIQKKFLYEGKGKKATGHYIIQEQKEITIQGPNKGLEKASKEFKKKRKNAYLKGKHWYRTKKTSIQKIYKETKKQEKEMNVKTTLQEEKIN